MVASGAASFLVSRLADSGIWLVKTPMTGRATKGTRSILEYLFICCQLLLIKFYVEKGFGGVGGNSIP